MRLPRPAAHEARPVHEINQYIVEKKLEPERSDSEFILLTTVLYYFSNSQGLPPLPFLKLSKNWKCSPSASVSVSKSQVDRTELSCQPTATGVTVDN